MTGRSWRLGRRMAALFFLLLFSLPASALDHDADRLARELISSSPTARAAALAAIKRAAAPISSHR